MEQRALLASALVLGCVTAAGAGGFLAVRGMASSSATEPVGQVAPDPEAIPADAAEGTVADIVTPDDTPTVTPSSSSAETQAPRPASAAVTATPPARTERPNPVSVSRQGSTPAAQPPTRPAAPVRREDPDTVARTSPSSSTRPAADTAVPAGAPRSEETSDDTWPSRDSAQATTDDRWASRDAANGSTSADTSLPSRTPVSETAAPSTPVRRLETVTIPADAVVGIQLEQGVSTATARVEDSVRARVTRDLVSGGDVVIPAGARLLGNVTLVEEGGRVKERARLGIRFHTLVLANGTEIKLPTETIYRDGESPAGKSAAKIGGAAVGGAILGALMGGGKGAVIGAATGAGSGTGWAMAGDRRPAELRAGQSLTVRVSDSVATQIER